MGSPSIRSSSSLHGWTASPHVAWGRVWQGEGLASLKRGPDSERVSREVAAMTSEPIPTWFLALVVVRKGDRFLVVHEKKHGQP